MENRRALRIMAIGAHPDDCDLRIGGTAIQYAEAGHKVLFVSTTNGDTGHHQMAGAELARRRFLEASQSAQVAGADYHCFDIHCGELIPSLEYRRQIMKMIREFNPDVVFTHRPNDYHPDHRYTSQLVQDAVYVCTVPGNMALTPAMTKMPVVFYFSDEITEPQPFRPDVAVAVDDVFEKKLSMLDCHESQMYEWLPFNRGIPDQVPATAEERRAWLGKQQEKRDAFHTDAARSALTRFYGDKRAVRIKLCEPFQLCGFGAQPRPDEIAELFPV